MLNSPNAPSTARSPRLRVMLLDAGVSGQSNQKGDAAFVPPPTNSPLRGVVSASVTNNNYYQADTFSVEFVLSQQSDLAFWSDQPRAVIDIQMSLDGNSWTPMLVGEIDDVECLPFSGEVQVTGRDLTARFIEAKTQEAFSNQTSSQVAATLAGRHGLKSSITPTTTLVSRFYQDEHTEITLGQFSRSTTEWDLLTNLARHEGFDCYVSGQTLYFNPRTDPASNPWVVSVDPYSVPKRGNVLDLRLKRALTLARDIEVRVRSWDSRNQRGFTKIARAIGAKGAQAAGGNAGLGVQRVDITLPNLTEAQAQLKANTILADMSKHERVISFRAPGDMVLTPRVMVQLQGTRTAFDQVYYADSVTRHISVTEGFTMDCRAKNRSAESWGFVQTVSNDTPAASVPLTITLPSQANTDISAALEKRWPL